MATVMPTTTVITITITTGDTPMRHRIKFSI